MVHFTSQQHLHSLPFDHYYFDDTIVMGIAVAITMVSSTTIKAYDGAQKQRQANPFRLIWARWHFAIAIVIDAADLIDIIVTTITTIINM